MHLKAAQMFSNDTRPDRMLEDIPREARIQSEMAGNFETVWHLTDIDICHVLEIRTDLANITSRASICLYYVDKWEWESLACLDAPYKSIQLPYDCTPFDIHICTWICVHAHICMIIPRDNKPRTHITFHFQCIGFDLSYWHKLHEWGSMCAPTYLILCLPPTCNDHIFLSTFWNYVMVI